MTTILSLLLGLGLAASCGLRTFLPLLLMGLAAHFHLGGVTLRDSLAWVASTPALLALGAAAAAELAADKIPLVDHGLHLVGTVTRPAAAVLAIYATFNHADPTSAALIALMLGAPTALAAHGAAAGARLASTATTAGFGNPLLSSAEDLLALLTAGLALLAPIVVPVVLVAFAWAWWRIRRRRRFAVAPAKAAPDL